MQPNNTPQPRTGLAPWVPVIVLFIIACAMIPVQRDLLGMSHHTYTGILFAAATVWFLVLAISSARKGN